MVDATPVRGTIRPLVWERGSAVTAVGCYTVIKQDRDDGPSWFVLIDGGSSGLFGEHISEDSAKAAAQADYEARILAAIQTDPRRATPEAPASLRAGEGFATSGAEARWIEDMKAGVYDADMPVPGWQPIETAPRDGTAILASGLDHGKGPSRHYSVVEWMDFGCESGWYPDEDVAPHIYLTHWMPLPAQPSEGVKP